MESVARSRHLMDLGVTSLPETNWQQILKEKNRFTAQIPESAVKGLRGSGVTYIEGEAEFVDDHTLETGKNHITFRYGVIATGAKPVTLSIEGEEHIATSSDFLDLERLPPRIIFIGGGFVSFEFAHFAARLGGKPGAVHILEAGSRPLKPFDSDMVEQLVEASRAEGIEIHTEVNISGIRKVDSGYQVLFQSGDKLEADLVVNGAGRMPDIDALQLEAAGVKIEKGGIVVDSSMKTTQPHIYAIGDCAATLKLARVADMEAKVAVGAILASEEGQELPVINYSAAPAVLFTYPQLGMVGKTEEQLQEENIKYWKSFDTQLSIPTYRRLGMKYAAYKILVDENDQILGAHLLSDNTTGMVNTFKQAMIDKIPIGKLRDDNIMSPYPSRESDILYMLNPLLD
jgi:glutathione reductase (NADPH)